MIEKILISLIAISFWTIDMILTILALKLQSTKDKNAWKSEFNYHRWFFKRYGIVSGGVISYALTLPFLIVIMALTDIKGNYLIMGITLTAAYYTYANYVTYIDKYGKRR